MRERDLTPKQIADAIEVLEKDGVVMVKLDAALVTLTRTPGKCEVDFVVTGEHAVSGKRKKELLRWCEVNVPELCRQWTRAVAARTVSP